MVNSPGFIPDDVARVARYIKTLSGAVDDADRKDTTNELRKIYRRSVAAIREHRKNTEPPECEEKALE